MRLVVASTKAEQPLEDISEMADRTLELAANQSQPISAVTDSPALKKIEEQVAVLAAAFTVFKVGRGRSRQRSPSGSSTWDSSTRLSFFVFAHHNNSLQNGISFALTPLVVWLHNTTIRTCSAPAADWQPCWYLGHPQQMMIFNWYYSCLWKVSWLLWECAQWPRFKVQTPVFPPVSCFCAWILILPRLLLLYRQKALHHTVAVAVATQSLWHTLKSPPMPDSLTIIVSCRGLHSQLFSS